MACDPLFLCREPNGGMREIRDVRISMYVGQHARNI